jgi:hypothetical protein
MSTASPELVTKRDAGARRDLPLRLDGGREEGLDDDRGVRRHDPTTDREPHVPTSVSPLPTRIRKGWFEGTTLPPVRCKNGRGGPVGQGLLSTRLPGCASAERHSCESRQRGQQAVLKVDVTNCWVRSA